MRRSARAIQAATGIGDCEYKTETPGNACLGCLDRLTSVVLQDIRDYELDYEAAKKAAASAAAEAEKEEERRIKMLEKNPLGDFMPEDEEMLNIGKTYQLPALIRSYVCQKVATESAAVGSSALALYTCMMQRCQ